MKRLAIVTGSRAEYGVLRPFLALASCSRLLTPCLIAAGAHLLPHLGNTVEAIVEDGYPLFGRVEMMDTDESLTGSARALGKGISGLADVFGALRPDALLVEGDRVEALAAALAAGYMGIPLVHSGGGDLTGTIDNAARHAISMFSWLHFVSTRQARERLCGFGIPGSDIHVVGGLGIDALHATAFPDRTSVLSRLGLSPGDRYLLVAFHPESAFQDQAGPWMETLLAAAEGTGLSLVITYPNGDPGSGGIIQALLSFSMRRKKQTRCFASLGHPGYLHALRHAEALVGNSSSGLHEAPTLKVPVVNVGRRQSGRAMAANIVSCGYEQGEITEALRTVLEDPDFRKKLPDTVNPFGDGQAAKRMLEILETRLYAREERHGTRDETPATYPPH